MVQMCHQHVLTNVSIYQHVFNPFKRVKLTESIPNKRNPLSVPHDPAVKHGTVTLSIDQFQCRILSPACTVARWSVAGHLALTTLCG